MVSLTYWSPIALIIALLVLLVITFIFRNRGRESYKKGTSQAQIFLSGEAPPEPEQRHVRAHHIYWGFFQALKRYYEPAMEAHTGIVNDYIIWFTSIAALTALIVFVAGLL